MDRIALVGCGENRWIGDFIRVIDYKQSIGLKSNSEIFDKRGNIMYDII